MKNGGEYEEYANKFLKGIRVGEVQENRDIETKTTYYEVKGACLQQKGGRTQMRLSKYQIIIANHRMLKEEAVRDGKKAKYVFVLRIGSRYIWKVFSWIGVDIFISANGMHINAKSKMKGIVEKRVVLKVRDIW